MADAVFPDNTVLINFGTVNRLDLLESWLRGRGRWTQAVASEVGKSSAHVPAMGAILAGRWLGTPIEITARQARIQVDLLRRNVFGGSQAQPTKHLGESETCYLIKYEKDWAGSWWISDDLDANEWALGQGIRVLTTAGVVKELVQDGDLTAQQGYDLLKTMVDAGRDNIGLPVSWRDLRA